VARAVSVVLPTHNRPQLVRRAIASIIEQDYIGDVECIVVFDQSEPDPSLNMSRPGRSVVVVTNDHTPGLAGARNAGSVHARHDLLAFCDDDDEWLPHKLSRQVEALEQSGAGLVVSGLLVDYQGKVSERIPAGEQLTAEGLFRSRVMEANMVTALIERRVWEEMGGADEAIPGSYGEDYDCMIRAVAATKALVVREPLVRIHWAGHSFFAQRWETIIAAIDYGLAKHPGFATEPKGLARLYGRKSFGYAALGKRAEARRWAGRTIRTYWREPRAYLALLISFRLLTPGLAQRLAHRSGRGI
jgi:glycosyltransferase involved in cell wall biosynthesis